MPTYGVQAAAFQPAIHVGRLNQANTAFVGEKEDATGMVLRAVAEYAQTNFNGQAHIEFDGFEIDITVTPKTTPATEHQP